MSLFVFPNGNNAASGSVVSPNNEVTNDGTFTYQFDANGNRTIRTRISTSYASDYNTTYAWDYRNRLTDVEFYDNKNVLTKRVHYVYDVYDNLIEEDIDPNGGGSYTTKEQFALDVSARVPSAGNAPLEKFDSSGNLVPNLPDDVLLELVNGQLAIRFLNGPSPSGQDVIYAEGAVNSLLQPDLPDWLFVNNQGSPTDVVNSDGNLIDHQVYSPFGQVVYVSNAWVFVLEGFTGGFADPNTGDIKLGERWYDPLSTVWISFDPAGIRGGDVNLARALGNEPTDASDVDGLQYEQELQLPDPTQDPSGSWPTSSYAWYAGWNDAQTNNAMTSGCPGLTQVQTGMPLTGGTWLLSQPGITTFGDPTNTPQQNYMLARAYYMAQKAAGNNPQIFVYQNTGATPGSLPDTAIPGPSDGCINYATLMHNDDGTWFWQYGNHGANSAKETGVPQKVYHVPFRTDLPTKPLGLPGTLCGKPVLTWVFSVYVPPRPTGGELPNGEARP